MNDSNVRLPFSHGISSLTIYPRDMIVNQAINIKLFSVNQIEAYQQKDCLDQTELKFLALENFLSNK